MLSSDPMARSGWKHGFRRKIETFAKSTHLPLLALFFLSAASLAAPSLAAIHTGDSLIRALREYQNAGTRLIFSSQIVSDDLRVLAPPAGATVEQQLRSLLAPHALDLKSLDTGGWVIVSRPDVAPGPSQQSPMAQTRSQRLDNIVVETSRYGFDSGPAAGGTRLNRTHIEALPGTNEDVVRSLRHVPGSTAGDFSARPHVRGGRDDETAFRYDGVTLIDPFHLKSFQGVFSALDPAVTDSVTYWTGAFPVEFGGNIGGVVDVIPRRPRTPTAEVGVSFLNNSLLFGTPFANDRGSLLLSGRTSNLSRVARLLDREIGEPNFQDLLARATWTLNERTDIAAGILGLDDSIDLSTEVPLQLATSDHRDVYSWMSLQHEWNADVRSETLLSSAILDGSRSAQFDRPGINSGSLKEMRHSSVYSLRQEANWTLSPRVSLRGGGEFSRAASHAVIDSSATFAAPFFPGVQSRARIDRNLDVRRRQSTLALYSALRWRLGGDSIVELGLRREGQQCRSEHECAQWNTRVNFWRRLSPDTTLRLAWGQYSQPPTLSQLDVADGFADIEAARRSTQVNLSLEHYFPHSTLLRLEAYDKRERSALATYENAFSPLALTPEIEVDRVLVNSGAAHMRGVELSLQSDRNRPMSAWGSYTYSQAYDRIDGVDVRRSWNQPHAFQAGALWKRGAWQISGIMNWHMGWPFTPLIASAATWQNPNSVTLALAPRNSAQQQHYRSLDLRLSWTKPLRVGRVEVTLEVKNAFNADNECCRSYAVSTDAGGRASLIESSRDWLPVTPLIGVKWRR